VPTKWQECCSTLAGVVADRGWKKALTRLKVNEIAAPSESGLAQRRRTCSEKYFTPVHPTSLPMALYYSRSFYAAKFKKEAGMFLEKGTI